MKRVIISGVAFTFWASVLLMQPSCDMLEPGDAEVGCYIDAAPALCLPWIPRQPPGRPTGDGSADGARDGDAGDARSDAEGGTKPEGGTDADAGGGNDADAETDADAAD